MMSSLAQIEKLGADNYNTWAVQMRSLLITLEYWEVIETRCPSNDDVSGKARWESFDKKALAYITLCVKSSELIHIKNSKTAKEAWMILSGLYSADGPARKVNLFKKLVRFRFNASDKIALQINEFCTTVDSLKSISIEMPDDLLCILLLCSLPDEMESFVVAIESRDQLPSFEQLKVKVLEEERRRNEKFGDNNESVFAASSNKWNKNAKSKVVSGSERNVKEALIKIIQSHVIGVLLNAMLVVSEDILSRSVKRLKESVLSVNSSESIASNNVWILDSGASSHMCSNVKFFSEIESREQVVTLASGDFVVAKGMGVIKVKFNTRDIVLKDVLYVPSLRGHFLSVSKIIERGYFVQFDKKKSTVKSRNSETIFRRK